MRLVKVFHQLTLRFAEMDESESLELYSEANQQYNEALTAAKSKVLSNTKRAEAIAANHSNPKAEFVAPDEQKLTVMDKLILQAEKWYVRYGLAIAYIIMVPIIREYMEGGAGEDDGDDAAEFFRMYTNYKKMKNS